MHILIKILFIVLQDLRPLYAGRCEYHSSETASDRDVRITFSLEVHRSKISSPSVYVLDLYCVLCQCRCLASKWRDYKVIFDLQVPCQTSSRTSCNLRVKSNTCYCCDLYHCGKWVSSGQASDKSSESVATYFAVLLWLFGFLMCTIVAFLWEIFFCITALIVLEQECFFSFNLCFREHPLMGLQNKDVLKKFRKSSMIWK